jgi:hypothetical protein
MRQILILVRLVLKKTTAHFCSFFNGSNIISFFYLLGSDSWTPANRHVSIIFFIEAELSVFFLGGGEMEDFDNEMSACLGNCRSLDFWVTLSPED